MPIIVIGADTTSGRAIIDRLVDRRRDLRAFVSDSDTAANMRTRGVKVAVGDISDGSHIGGAATGCFTAVMIVRAAVDGRSQAFSTSPAATVQSWISTIAEAGVTRVIWIGDPGVKGIGADLAEVFDEVGLIDSTNDTGTIAAQVVRLDEAGKLDEV